MANEQRVVELIIDASAAEAGVRRAEMAYEHFGDRAAAMVAKVQAQMAVQTQVLDRNTGSVNATSAAWDRLRAATDPVLAAQLKLERQMTASINVVNRAVLQGVATEEQAAAEIIKIRQKQISDLDAVRAAHETTAAVMRDHPIEAANQNSVSQGARRAAGINAGYQLQDIVVSAAGGSSPGLIALQQGTQLADAFAQSGGGIRGVASTAAAAVGSLLNPVSLASVAFTGLTAAAIQYFSKAKSGAAETNELLQKQNEIITQAARSWGDALPSIKAYADQLDLAQHRSEGLQAVQAISKDAFDGLGKDLLKTNQDFTAAVRSLRGIDADPKFISQFVHDFSDLKQHLDDGTASLAQVNAAQQTLAEGMQTYGTKEVEKFGAVFQRITGFINNAVEAVHRYNSEYYTAIAGADNVQDIVSRSTFRDEDGRTRAAADFVPRVVPTPTQRPNIELEGSDDDRIRQEMDSARKAFDAQLQSMRARSPAEMGAAARASALAQFNDRETEPQTQQRVDLAGRLAEAQAQHTLDEAAKERKRSLDETIASQRLELLTIGRTGSEVAALRMQYQLTSQVQAEAAKNNITASQQELDLIKQKSVEYGRLAEQVSRANLGNDLQFERDQLYRSPVDQQIASRQRSAGVAVDLNAPEADYMRQTARIEETRTAVKGFLTDFSQQLVSSGGNVGKAMGNAIRDAALNALQKIGDKAFDRLASFVTDILTGGNKSAAPGIGGAANSAAGVGASLLGAANDNGTRATLASGSGAAAQAWNFFAQKGLQPHQIAGVLGNINAESAFNPNAVGDAGKAFGLFQNHAARGGSQDLLASGVNGQLEHAWAELQGPENKAFQALMKSTDVRGATAAFAGFERPRGWSMANPEGADNFAGRLSGAEQALARFGNTTSTATAGVGQLGTGLGQLGQSLSSSVAGAAQGSASGGGLLGWIGNGLASLFGGGSSLVPAINKVPVPTPRPAGFARGGYTGAGGINDPAGVVHRGEVVWSQADVARAGGVAVVDAMRLGRRGYAAGGPVDIPPIRSAPANSNSGRSGPIPVDIGVTFDEDAGFRAYVKKTSREQASQVSQQGLADYSETQRRGGFLQMQQRATAQKG